MFTSKTFFSQRALRRPLVPVVLFVLTAAALPSTAWATPPIGGTTGTIDNAVISGGGVLVGTGTHSIQSAVGQTAVGVSVIGSGAEANHGWPAPDPAPLALEGPTPLETYTYSAEQDLEVQATGGSGDYTFTWEWDADGFGAGEPPAPLSESTHPDSTTSVTINNVGGVSTLTLTGLAPSASGEYRCTVSDTGPDADVVSQAATFEKRTPLAVTLSPATTSPDNYIDTLTLTADTQGGFEPLAYTWEFSDDGGDTWTEVENGTTTYAAPGYDPENPTGTVDVDVTVSGADGPVLEIDFPLNNVHGGLYRCSVEDDQYPSQGLSEGADDGESTVTMQDQVVIIEQPVGGEYYDGNEESLAVVVIGGNPNFYEYQWRYEGEAASDNTVYEWTIAGATDNPYVFTASANLAELSNPAFPSVGWKANTGSSGEYKVTVTSTSGGGADTSDWAAVDVREEVVASIDTPADDLTKNVTETLTITASATGGYPDTGYDFQWSYDGTPLSEGGRFTGVNSETLTITDLEEADDGDYTVTVWDSKGPGCPEHNETCTSDATAAVTITNFILVQQEPVSQKVYQGDTLDFTVEGGGGEPPYTFVWSWDFEEPFDNHDDGQIFSLSDGAPHPLTNSVVTITNTDTTSTLELADVITGDPADTGGYSCVISDREGNFNEDTSTSQTAILEVFPPVSIDTPPAPTRRYAGQEATFTVQASGGIDEVRAYQWQADDGSGFVDLSNGGGVSGADSAVLTVSGLAVADDGTEYRCVVTADDGAVPTDPTNTEAVSMAATLYVSAPLEVTSPPADYAAYVNDSTFELAAEFEGGKAPYSTDWRLRGLDPTTPETSAGSGSLDTGTPNTASIMVNPGMLGVGRYEYLVAITDQVTTTRSDPAMVDIAEYPAFNPPLTDASVPENRRLRWSVDVTGGLAPITYQWQYLTDDGAATPVWQDLSDGGTISGATTDTLEISKVSFDDAGMYRVVVNDGLGAEITSEASLTVTQALPVAGGLGLAVLATLSALGGAAALRRKRD